MLSSMLHAMLLLPPQTVHPLLQDLLNLVPHLDRLNRLLPSTPLLEREELESMAPPPDKGKFKDEIAGSPLHREHRELNCQGNNREFGNFAKTQNFVC